MSSPSHRGRRMVFVIFPVIVGAVLVLGGFLFRTSFRIDKLRQQAILEATFSVANERVQRLDRYVIAQDNAIESEVNLARPLEFNEVWLPSAARETPTIRAVMIVDESDPERLVLSFASRGPGREDENFRRLVLHSMWKDLKLQEEDPKLRHLHRSYGGKSYLVSYWQKRHRGRRYLILAWHDVPRLVHEVFPRMYESASGKSQITIVDEKGRPIFGSTPASGEFSVGRPFPTTLYGWRLQVALSASGDLGDQVERRRRLELLLVSVACTVIVLGVAFVLYAVEKERRLSLQKSEFVANVSHELKTPLSLVRMFTELLISNRVASEKKREEYLQIMLAESERLTALIENVLDFARVERGKASFTFAEDELCDVVGRAAEMYHYRAERDGVSINVHAPPGVGRVKLDHRAIELSLINLIDNALKYAKDGKRIEISLVRVGRFVEVHVEDDGPGLPQEARRRVFERFWRSKSARDSRVRGTGIGLSLVENIARAHKGYARVRAAKSGGACFIVGLPALPDESPSGATCPTPIETSGSQLRRLPMNAPSLMGPKEPKSGDVICLLPPTKEKRHSSAMRSLGPLEHAMARYADGDEQSFSQVYDLAAPRIYSFLLKLCRDATLAEDLTHETFLRMHRARGMYRKDAQVLPWAFAIARRLFLDHIRAHKRERASLDRGGDDRRSDPGVPSNEPAADQEVAVRALISEIEAILEKIPETQATAFRLLKQEGMSVAEAASVLGATTTTVKLRAHRAYEALRKSLGPEWDVPGRKAKGSRS